MGNYRLYRIDGAGRISAADWLEAADDDTAREQAVDLCVDGGAVELWARDRLVARLGSGPAPIVARTQSHGKTGAAQSGS